MRAACPFVISWARIGLWATLFQSIWVQKQLVLDRSPDGPPKGPRSLTSFRHFCCRIANKKRAITLSLFDMMAVLVVGPRSDREGEERGSGRRPATQPRTEERSKSGSEAGRVAQYELERQGLTATGRSCGKDHCSRNPLFRCGEVSHYCVR